MNAIKLAVVIPWFGKELKGGAEQLAWQIAHRLGKRDIDLTVLTTCSKQFISDWSINDYKPGDYEEFGIKIKRFSVKARDSGKFDRVNSTLMTCKPPILTSGISPISSADEKVFLTENIYSPDLQKHIEKNKNHYDFFIFLPYLFPNIIKGIEAVKDKAILQSCLHDESYAYLDCITDIHLWAKRLFFNSMGEYELARKIYGPSIIKRSRLVYSGIESPKIDNVKYERFLLCLGRRDTGKNTHLLINSFDAFIDKTQSDLKLLIAGVGDMPITPKNKNIIDLGLISEEEKLKLLGTCSALINPSENESFSRVIYEAWYASKPVIVHKHCRATQQALEESNMAGFSADSQIEFESLFEKIAHLDTGALKKLGEQGKKYAQEVADWDRVIDRYISEFNNLLTQKNKNTKQDKFTIYQLMPGFEAGDAVSNQAIAIRNELLKMGYNSVILAQFIDDKVKHLAQQFKKGIMQKNDILLYHHSIGFDYIKDAINFNGKKALIYHNITPKDFFEPYNPELAKILENGRKELKLLADDFKNCYADSYFNADELKFNNFHRPKVLPLIVDPDRWNFKPDPTIIHKLNDGKKNILFTGRIAPNKKQTDLIKMMPHLLKVNPDVRLCIVGNNFSMSDTYVNEVYSLINELGLNNDVWISGKLNEQELKSCFMCADLYFSPSEHEGFGVPLIEAMWFDIPILAYKSTAVPETLSSAAVMIDNKKDLPYIAILVDMLLSDKKLRDKIIHAQRHVREKYSLENCQPIYAKLIQELINA